MAYSPQIRPLNLAIPAGADTTDADDNAASTVSARPSGVVAQCTEAADTLENSGRRESSSAQGGPGGPGMDGPTSGRPAPDAVNTNSVDPAQFVCLSCRHYGEIHQLDSDAIGSKGNLHRLCERYTDDEGQISLTEMTISACLRFFPAAWWTLAGWRRWRVNRDRIAEEHQRIAEENQRLREALGKE